MTEQLKLYQKLFKGIYDILGFKLFNLYLNIGQNEQCKLYSFKIDSGIFPQQMICDFQVKHNNDLEQQLIQMLLLKSKKIQLITMHSSKLLNRFNTKNILMQFPRFKDEVKELIKSYKKDESYGKCELFYDPINLVPYRSWSLKFSIRKQFLNNQNDVNDFISIFKEQYEKDINDIQTDYEYGLVMGSKQKVIDYYKQTYPTKAHSMSPENQFNEWQKQNKTKGLMFHCEFTTKAKQEIKKKLQLQDNKQPLSIPQMDLRIENKYVILTQDSYSELITNKKVKFNTYGDFINNNPTIIDN